MKIVENLDVLKKYNAVDGDTACTADNNKVYIYHKNEWEEYKPVNGEIQMSLYDINANIIEQLGPCNDEKRKEIINNINEKYKGTYYMMLCNDIRYYTVFVYDDNFFCNAGDSLGEAVVDCATNVGPIYDAYENNNGAFEIWVKDKTDVMRCLVLFDYEQGIVYYGQV